MIRHAIRNALTIVGLSAAVTAGVGCSTPRRIALPAPFPLTYGGTTVPSAGAIVGFELADGLRGQELRRTETVGPAAGFGFGDRVSIGIAGFAGHEESDKVGSILRVGVRVGDLLSGVVKRPTSTAIKFARVKNARFDSPEQDDRLTSVDVAIPTEVLLKDTGIGRAGLYVGPRITHHEIQDALKPSDSLAHTYFGALAGAHLQYRFLNVFGEITVTHVPAGEFRGAATGGRFTVMPALGITALIGKAHQWKKK